mgnify:CR=1 FL=1
MKKLLSTVIVLVMLFSLMVPGLATNSESNVIYYYALRTANNPGYYFSGALLDMGVTLNAGDVDKDTFSAKARVTEYNGSVQGSFGSFGWDPEKESYALGDGWAKWNILDAYVSDADGNRVESGEYVKIDIEWETRTIPSGASDASRYDVPATRAAWYTAGGYIGFASIELEITQEKEVPGIENAVYIQGETKHDPIFSQFVIEDAPGGGKYALYTPANASEDNKRPLLVWFHGTGERYQGDNPGGNLIGNRALSFADKEFQEALDGCYVLAPQSTTSGWSSSRLDDMEALINQVIADNHIDITRVFVGGLSMGTGMTTPLITSTTGNSIPFAAAILCSGGSISTSQAQIIAEKGFPVYLVGSTSDFATYGFNSSYSNLLAAGVDAKMKLYPAGPVFDGKHYYGAHDAWNYIYNNLVEDENGETIFEWLAKQKIPMPLNVTTTANLIKQGDIFDVLASFRDTTSTNAASIVFNFDYSKFELIGALDAIDNVDILTREEKDGEIKLTLMIADYKAKDLAKIRFKAKENADLQNEESSIQTVVNYVYRDNTGNKYVLATSGSTSFATSGGIPGDTDGDGIVTLIDLSNVIDMFGVTSSSSQWSRARFYDFNNNNEIDISDIVYVAKLIQ